MKEIEVGQDVYYYNSGIIRKALILKIDNYNNNKIYTIEVMFKNNFNPLCHDKIISVFGCYFLFGNKENLIDKMEDDLYHLQYNINLLKKGEI